MSTDKCTHGWTTPPECPSCMAMELDALRDNNLTLNVVNERLSCEIGNLKIELDSLRQENNRLRFQLHTILDQKEAELKRLRGALAFYADPESYHAIAFMFDKPCGGFADDFSMNHGHSDYMRSMPGKLARTALNPPKRS